MTSAPSRTRPISDEDDEEGEGPVTKALDLKRRFKKKQALTNRPQAAAAWLDAEISCWTVTRREDSKEQTL